MTASAVSVILEQFRARLPEFDTVSDVVAEDAISDALAIYSLCDRPVVYLAAHLLALDAESGLGSSGASVDGGDGETLSESAGGVSASFKGMADRGKDSFYTTTAYGRKFLAMRDTTPARAFSVRVY